MRRSNGAEYRPLSARCSRRLPYPTDDTRLITKAASAGLELIFRAGFAFSKAEILLLDLRQRGEFTDDLFVATPPMAAERVMGVMDATCRGAGETGLGHAAGDDEPELYDAD